jgi:drug/metabolite transporter (DMT)-like permease
VSRRGWLLFSAMGVIWGIPYLLIKIAVGEVSPGVLVFIRTAGGALLLAPLVLRRGQLRALRGHWWAVLAFATIELVGPWLLLSDAERTLSSSMTGLVLASVPILGVVMTRLIGDRQRITAVRLIGLLLGFAGVTVLAAPALRGGSAWPIAEVLLTALGYATAPIIADRALRAVPSLTLTAVCLAFTGLVYAPVAAWTWPSHLPSRPVLAALAGLVVICTALAFVVFLELIAEVGSARATVITYVNPAVAVALGVAILHEPFTPTIAGSFVLILAGSVLGTRRTPEPTPSPRGDGIGAVGGGLDGVQVGVPPTGGH